MKDHFLNYLRITLYAAAMILCLSLFQAWQAEHAQLVEAAPQTMMGANTTSTSPSPTLNDNTSTPLIKHTQQGSLITVTTDTLAVKINTLGGDIVESKLLNYTESLENKTPFLLMNDDPKTRYIAESGLVDKAGPDTAAQSANYSTTKTAYQLAPDQNSLQVVLTWQKNNVQVKKIFTFFRNRYDIQVTYEINNHATTPWQGNLYTQLTRTNTPPKSNGGMVSLATYFGAAISKPDKPFDKIAFKNMQANPVNFHAQDGWVAMIQHYFIGAWIPPKTATSTYYSKAMPDNLYTIGMISDPLTVEPGGTLITSMQLYTGPAIASLLEKVAPALKLTIDYGWFWFISDIIFWMMQKIYDVVHNWGWSIVLVTLVIKLLFYKLSDKSYRSMSKLKKLQPRIEALRERYKDDKQKLTQATLDLYRQEKVNPMGGCLPILIQIPVFIALYWVLVESVQLRQAPFILWIHDLSKADPYYVLPVLMGLSMFVQQRLNPPPPDPMQAKAMMFMPFIFTFLFANFPAGLMLYWFVNNTLSFLQQWFIMGKINKA